MTITMDRVSALTALKKDAVSTWITLPKEFISDKEFVLTVLEQAPVLPPKSDFERTFPQSLRFDRDVVLGFCKRPDFTTLYYERHLYVPDCLTNDKEVMLAYCRSIPRSLQECTEELCDDEQVVEAAIELDGLELQYASMRLQEDKEMVIRACQKNGGALEFCPPGAVRDALTADRDFMLTVLRKHGGPMLRLVSEPLKRDRELLLEALAHGMRLRYCPYDYQTDRAFLLDAMDRKALLYMEFNRSTQMDKEIAKAAICSPSSTPQVIARALEHADLEMCRDVVLSICHRGDVDFCRDLFQQANFKDDKEIVLAVLKKDPKLFSQATERLQRDPDVILAAIEESTAIDVIRAVSPETQQAHPEIVCKAIQHTSRRLMRHLRTYIRPESLWSNRDVAIAWIRRGNRVLDAFENLLQDPEVALEIAHYSFMEFSRVSENLRGDMDFMMKAVSRNGRVFRFTVSRLLANKQLAIAAVANTADALVGTTTSREELTTYCQEKLDLQKTFVMDFLRGIAISKPHVPPAKRSQLSLLDRGVETSQAFKQLIASFLGVPVGTDLALMRVALANLKLPVSTTSIDLAAAEATDDEHDLHRNLLERRRFRLFRRRPQQQQNNNDLNNDLDEDIVIAMMQADADPWEMIMGE
jgi:hypothetical protein